MPSLSRNSDSERPLTAQPEAKPDNAMNHAKQRANANFRDARQLGVPFSETQIQSA
jgi:hypothetical protein